MNRDLVATRLRSSSSNDWILIFEISFFIFSFERREGYTIAIPERSYNKNDNRTNQYHSHGRIWLVGWCKSIGHGTYETGQNKKDGAGSVQ